MTLLDLFCGAGGAAMGYSRAGFDVVGVDIHPQPDYPFAFIQADALTFPLLGFDVIHASPPCQAYSRLSVMPTARSGHPDLLSLVLDRVQATGVSWVVENVDGAPFPPEVHRVQLCGSMFGLRMRRHRWFATNVAMLVPRCQHDPAVDLVGVYGASDGEHAPGFKHPGIRRGPRQGSTRECREVMGMPWVRRRRGLTEAIPPAYTEYIGRQLMAQLKAVA